MFPKSTDDLVLTKLSISKDSSKFPFKIFAQNEELSDCEELAGRLQLLRFLTLPLKFSFCLCLSPFYLKVSKSKENGLPKTTVSAKTMLLQKISCALLTILDLFWMIQFARKSFPDDPKNPSHHINMVSTAISQVFKCVMFKKLWLNQKDFEKIGNFILTSRIPVSQTKWLSKKGTGLICFLLLLYTTLGLVYIDWVGGSTKFLNTETSHLEEVSHWWGGMIASGKYNFFLTNSTSTAAATVLSPLVENLIGVLSAAGLFHR